MQRRQFLTSAGISAVTSATLVSCQSAIADLVGWVDERKPNNLETKIKCGRIKTE